jgi:hypothetical protein
MHLRLIRSPLLRALAVALIAVVALPALAGQLLPARAAVGVLGDLGGVTAMTAQAGTADSGGRAVVHRAGGRAVGADEYDGPVPEARLYQTGTLGVEPTLGIHPDGEIFYVGFSGGAAQQAPVVRSDDGGATWTEVSPRVAGQRTHAITLDPMLHVDKDTGRVFTADLSTVTCSFVSHSDDKGASWTTSKACGPTDHQNVFTGPPALSPTVGYPNVVYYCAIDGGLLFAFGTMTSCLKSLDGGLTWVKTGAPAFTDDPRQTSGNLGVPGHCGGATGHGFVDDDGTVYLPRGWCGQPYLAISDDEGATWRRVQVADTGMADDGTLQEHEAGVAVDRSGNVYYAWTGRNRLPYLAISRDGGATWSQPLMIGPPGLTEANLPAIDIGDDGKVAITYMGSTNAPGGEAPTGSGPAYAKATWNGYITMTVDALADDPLFFTAPVNDPADPFVKGGCGVGRCQQVFDFIDVVIAPDGTPYTSMVDGCPRRGACPSLGQGVVGRLVGGPPLIESGA